MDNKTFDGYLDKFFTPSSPAVDNYVSRNDADERLIDALSEKGLQIIVYGSTGVGKSSLGAR